MNKQYKVILAGDSNVGKSFYVNTLLNTYPFGGPKPTIGVEVHPVNKFNTIFNIWDLAGDEKNSGLIEGYYIGADCAIVMFDCKNQTSKESVEKKWIPEIKNYIADVPIVIVGTNSDVPSQINLSYISINNKKKYNCDEPLNKLLQLMNS
jgi:GTP-binding nuclear protein Ran